MWMKAFPASLLLLLLFVALWNVALTNALQIRRPRLGLASGMRGSSCTRYSYETRYFTQRLDHFNAAESHTFQQRYLVSTDHWTSGGPIFFYTGNEGDITWFCSNTGFVWDIAPTFGAMVVFAEHRYYGKSLPFGNESYKDAAHLSYLTSEQALADFAVLITALKGSLYKSPSSAVVAFGGSYGGMLAAWFRMKYPALVQGSIAASAPIWLFTGLAACDSPYVTITRDFAGANVNCSDNVQQSWSAIERVASQDLPWLSSTFRLCSPLSADEVGGFSGWLMNTWFNLAMVDYPYPADFLAPLPAWPVNRTCDYLSVRITDDRQLLQAVARALMVYYNSTDTTACLNISQDATPSLGERGWNFQACTEMVMPMCSTDKDMFPVMQWNFTEYSEQCRKNFGVTPRPFWVETLYGGKNISASSNIVFSNGLLDPWSGGGVLQSISDSLVAVIIPNGAHHLDLRASNPQDPADVLAARKLEVEHISKWIKSYKDAQF